MSIPIVFRRIARAEVNEAADWYEAKSLGRGAAFTTAVRDLLTSIRTDPPLHPVVHGEVREALL